MVSYPADGRVNPPTGLGPTNSCRDGIKECSPGGIRPRFSNPQGDPERRRFAGNRAARGFTGPQVRRNDPKGPAHRTGSTPDGTTTSRKRKGPSAVYKPQRSSPLPGAGASFDSNGNSSLPRPLAR